MPLHPKLLQRVPRPLLAAAYRVAEAADRVALGVRGLRHPDDIPLPPMRLRARVGSRSAAEFVRAGRDCADALRAASRGHLRREIEEEDRILDFGCGCGRTLRHFLPVPVEGCDVDREAIEWMRRAIEPGRFVVNRFDPPLPFPGASFDLVYSVSIFTHLGERSQLAWLGELARILKPGGCALLTVQSEHALGLFRAGALEITSSMARRLARHDSILEEGGFIFEPYEADTARAFPGVTSDYGLAFQSREYLEREWSRFFELRGVDVGSVDGLQDVVALRKPRDPGRAA